MESKENELIWKSLIKESENALGPEGDADWQLSDELHDVLHEGLGEVWKINLIGTDMNEASPQQLLKAREQLKTYIGVWIDDNLPITDLEQLHDDIDGSSIPTKIKPHGHWRDSHQHGEEDVTG